MIIHFLINHLDIYNIISKIAKSSKKTRFDTVNLMQAMLSRAPEDIYFSKSPNYVDELFKYFQELVKSKKYDKKFKGLDFIREFVLEMKPDYIQKDMQRFSNFIKAALSHIFVKKVVYSPQECVALENFLVDFSKKHVHQGEKLVEEVLEQPYPIEQKAVALRALAKMARNSPEEIGSYNIQLGPMVTNFLTDEKLKKELVLLRSALLCFPRIKNPSEEKMKEVWHKKSLLTLFRSEILSDNV